MATAARPLEVQQLQAYLTTEFSGHIQGTGHTALDQERNFLSKALAAFFLMVEAGASKADAVAASIDGGNDHGIDSVYISPTGVLWLVQSKYIHDGRGEPLLGDASKFKDGVQDLVRGRFQRFNSALQAKQPDIERLTKGEYQVRFALVYTGTSLDDDRRQLFGDVEKGINSIQADRARFIRFGLVDFHDAITAKHAEQNITIEVELSNFGMIASPARAFYGVMQVGALAGLYQQHDHALVRANIRRYRGSSEVNARITSTLTDAPQHFVYFNNGITILCDRITVVGQMDPERNTGRFQLTGASIINGAQTAGTVAMQNLAHYDTHPASVLVTLIQAAGQPDNFGDLVTEYRNSQNAVQVQDFIALDDNQESWRRTLQTSGITYIYKQSASDPHASGQVFTAQEAAQYLAAANADGNTCIAGLLLAQNRPADLWSRSTDFAGAAVTDKQASVYGRLFPDSLTARRLWRTTQMGRFMREVVEADVAALMPTKPAAAALMHAALPMVMHIVFIRLKALAEAEALILTTAERDQISLELDAVRAAVETEYAKPAWSGKEPATAFGDAGDLRTLKRDLMRVLNP